MIDLEKLDKLPKRQGRKGYLTEKYGDLYNLKRFDHCWDLSDNNYSPWVKAQRIINKYLGKSFDEAFSKYCKQVRIYEQKEFLDYFNIYKWQGRYFIDINGNIQKIVEEKRKRKIVFIPFGYNYYQYSNELKLYFDSKNDKTYKKLNKEKIRLQKIYWKNHLKENSINAEMALRFRKKIVSEESKL